MDELLPVNLTGLKYKYIYQKRNIYSSTIEAVTMCEAESWMINKDIHRKLLVTEMGFWRRCVRKALQDKVWNEVVREELEVQKAIKGGIDDK
jgi:hypothetical protein